ncbi:MAG TPA: LamG domain-containing protein [Kiritimatiellia bacterium]|nr:LamG domain-containing protein [Kiritimatiellia bacterium]
MNRFIRVLGLFLLPLLAGQAMAGLNEGLVLHYSFDAAPNGGVIADESSFHNDGLVVGAPALAAGRIGGAWAFNGTSDYIWRLGNASLDVGDQFTCSIWYNAASYNVQRPLMEWCLTSAGYGHDYGLHLWCNVHGGAWYGSGANLVTTWAGDSHIICVTDLSLNAWHHMVVTFSKATGDALLYIDGSLVSSNHFGSIHPLTAADFYLGRRPSVSSAYWHGLLDDARVYNRVLSASEVKELYALPASAEDGLVLYYSFNTDFNGWVADESGNCNNGVARSGATRTAAGACDGGFTFDGVDDDIQVANAPSLNPTNEITLASWFKCDGPGTWNGIILLKGTAARVSDAGEYALVYFPNNNQGVMGKVAFALRTTDTGWWREYYSDRPLETGVWHHVVGTYKPGEWNLYVDGVLARPTVTDWRGTIRPQTGDLYIGAEHSFPNDEYFKGNIDEVRIYKRCLSAAEVSNLYARCGPGLGGASPVEQPYITQIGFSYDPQGDQDVNVFYTDETFYVKVKDVSLESSPQDQIRVRLQQPGVKKTVWIKLARGADGWFTGSASLESFRVGTVQVRVSGKFGGVAKLIKDAELTIRSPSDL